MTKAQEQEKKEAIERLRKEIKPGQTLHTILRHVSKSGMSRSISVVQIKGGETYDWSYLIAKAIGWKIDQKHDGIKVSGCGMDMGFHVVYTLSAILYGYGSKNGYPCLGDKCPSNVHFNNPNAPRGKGKGIRHTDGYAISQRWL